MDAGTLYDAIIPVCPITTTRVGVADNRSTWVYDPAPGATTAQKAAADNVIATIPIEPKSLSLPTNEFIARFTNAEYLALERKRATDITTGSGKIGNAKNWDIVIADTSINMNKQKTQSLKADLVTDGILTQARADEIFS